MIGTVCYISQKFQQFSTILMTGRYGYIKSEICLQSGKAGVETDAATRRVFFISLTALRFRAKLPDQFPGMREKPQKAGARSQFEILKGKSRRDSASDQ